MTNTPIRWRAVLAAAVLAASAGSAEAQTPVQFSTPDGSTSISFGVLTQALLQRDTADGVPSTHDLCFRRLRFIGGGKLASRVKLFVDSDTPYMGEHNAVWSMPATFLQDLIVTLEWKTALQVDAGLLLVPGSYNGTQSAASLLAVGYGPYSFLASAPTHSRVGRDQGVQARGYLAKSRLEYRVGAFRGVSKVDPSAPLRYVGRIAFHPFGAQTGFFYTGTTHGKKKMLGIGASVDHQDRYTAYTADLFGEWPLRNGDTLTTQVDFTQYDGGRTFTQLPKQHTFMVEGSYCRRRIGAFAQVARQDIAEFGRADASALQVGMLYWAKGHRRNVKLGIGRTMKDRTPAHTQVLVQSQLFIF